MDKKTTDNLIYLSVGLAIAAGFVGYMFYTERTTGEIREIPGPILWAILSTPGIVALIFEQFWQHRHRPLLWAVSAFAALINICIIVVACRFEWKPPTIVCGLVSGAWLTLVLLGAPRFLDRRVD